MSFPNPDPNKGGESSVVPPGFRFHPTDEELVGYYLTQKLMNSNFVFQAIGEVDMNKCEPWDLSAKAKMSGQNEVYFFNLRDRKYPTGIRANRATEAGYWKATGKDRKVMSERTKGLLGMKKTLVFYTGRAPSGHRTNWIMHEYRLEGESKPLQLQEWVVCRVFKKSILLKRPLAESESRADQLTGSFLPALHTLESPRLHSVKGNFNYPGQGTLAEQLGYLQSAVFPAHEAIRRPLNSSMKVKKEPKLGDSIEHLISGWDMYSPEPIWDVSVTPY